MIAVPVDSDNLDCTLSPRFGKAPWFALVSVGGTVRFWKNIFQSGREVVKYLRANSVEKIIFQDIGSSALIMLNNAQIQSFHAGHGKILLSESLEYLQRRSLIRVHAGNMIEYVDSPHKHSTEKPHLRTRCNHHHYVHPQHPNTTSVSS